MKDFLLSPELSRKLLEGLSESSTLLADEKGLVKFLSHKAVRFLNISESEALGKNILNLMPLASLENKTIVPAHNPLVQSLTQQEYNQINPFFCLLKLPGQKIQIALNVLQIQEDGRLIGIVVKFREIQRTLDVSEMKTLFLSFAAHQLKTPSSIVKGFLELALREGEAAYSATQWDNLNSAHQANDRLIKLTKSLLNLSRLEGGMVQPELRQVNLTTLVQEKIDANLSLSNGSVTIRNKVQQIQAYTDSTFLGEILDIFLQNAIRFSPAGSVITVTTDQRNGSLFLYVEDNGPGVPTEKLATLFSEVQGQNPEANTHGLGLLIGSKYAALLKGKLGAENTERGARFWIEIPQNSI